MQLGQEQLLALREKLTIHIGLINHYTRSLRMGAVGKMEPMMVKILELLQKGVQHDRRKANTFVSAYETDNQQTWEPLEMELQMEGIPIEYLEENCDVVPGDDEHGT